MSTPHPHKHPEPSAEPANARVALLSQYMPVSVSTCGASCGCSHTEGTLGELTGAQVGADGTLTPIRIMQMDCPTEEALLRKKLGGMAGVKQLEFNLLQRVLTVKHEADALDDILAGIRALGFTPELADTTAPRMTPENPGQHVWLPLAIGGVAAFAAEGLDWANGPTWLVAMLALGAILACGTTTYKKGWIALRNRTLNINALMSIAVTGAVLIGQWPEAAMVMVLFTLAEWIEAKSLDRARHAISGLMELSPEHATVVGADASLQEQEARHIRLDSIIRVKPGERIALDGVVVRGHTTINQAPITGESIPVEKALGDPVYAGTINGHQGFDFRVTAEAKQTTLARIIHAVEQAQANKAPTQRFVDRFAAVYTPAVMLIAVLVAILPPLVAGGAWLVWAYKALVLLVIACPCALVISTPVSIVSGLAAAARHGILVKGGVYLEQAHRLRWLALDKTGTLTQGRPQQTDFIPLPGLAAELSQQMAYSLASQSDHPVSQAIAEASKSQQALPVEHFTALTGRGVRGEINGQTYHLGNHRLIEELQLCSPQLEAQLKTLESAGKTVVMLADKRAVLALFAVADTLKDSSREAIAALHALGVKTVMLTGDNVHTAQAIGAQAGIDAIAGNQLPEDKAAYIAKLAQNGQVGMVGDGINDAPALARAHIGFAMGALGTGTAIETADVALMDDDLRKIPRFIRLSAATRTVLMQNIVFALGIKSVFLVLTLLGLGTMWMAVFADVGASLLVVLNGLRLLRQ